VDSLSVGDSSAERIEDGLDCLRWVGGCPAGEDVDVGEMVLGPGGHGDVGLGEDEDAGSSVWLEGFDELGADGAAERFGGLPHRGHDLLGWHMGMGALGDVEDGVNHRFASFHAVRRAVAGRPASIRAVM
jgi:hypothetical protein